MNPTEEELEKIRVHATLVGNLDRYVYLREDDKGRYIEYAFKDGAPHDNRCLSWYDNPHPKYLEKHPNTVIPLSKVNELYWLGSYTCSGRCKPGHPSEDCDYYKCIKNEWNYDEPIKCACWGLGKPIIPNATSIPIEVAVKYKDLLIKEIDNQGILK